MAGKAEDIGDTCDGLVSSDAEVRWGGTLLLGVGGTFPFPAGATLPMNHD